MFEEFKKFIMRGNVVDLAVGVIIGLAFGATASADRRTDSRGKAPHRNSGFVEAWCGSECQDAAIAPLQLDPLWDSGWGKHREQLDHVRFRECCK